MADPDSYYVFQGKIFLVGSRLIFEFFEIQFFFYRGSDRDSGQLHLYPKLGVHCLLNTAGHKIGMIIGVKKSWLPDIQTYAMVLSFLLSPFFHIRQSQIPGPNFITITFHWQHVFLNFQLCRCYPEKALKFYLLKKKS